MVNLIIMLALLSTSWLLAKECTDLYGVINTASYRLIFSTLSIFFIYIFIYKKAPNFILNKYTVLASMFGFVGYFSLISLALSISNPSSVGLSTTLLPVFGYFLAIRLRSEIFMPAKFFACCMAVFGCILFSGVSLFTINIGGLALGMAAVVSYAVYGAIYKKSLADFSSLDILYSCLIIASVPATGLLFLLNIKGGGEIIPSLGYVKLFLLGAVFTAPIYLTYQNIIRQYGTTIANTVGLITPFLILLGELTMGSRYTVNSNEAAGLLVCIFSIYYILTANKIDVKSTAKENLK